MARFLLLDIVEDIVKKRKPTKLGMQLAIVFAAVNFAFTLALAVFTSAMWKMNRTYRRILDYELKLQTTASSIHSLASDAERYAFEFLDTRKLDSATYVAGALTAMRSEIKSLQSLGGDGTQSSDLLKAVADIQGQTQLFSGTFNDIVSSWTTMGLDEDSGLQGEFRNAAHALEAGIAGNNRLAVLYLTLRRHEKNYLLRSTRQYVDEALQTLAALQRTLVSSGMSQAAAKHGTKLLDNYRKSFLALVTETDRLSGLTNQLRSAMGPIQTDTEALITEARQSADSSVSSARTMVITELFITIGLALLAIIASFVLGFVFSRRLLLQLGGEPYYIAEVARAIAAGDLSIAFEERRKETGIFREMKTMVGSLKRIVGEVQLAADNVSSGSRQASVAAERVQEIAAASAEQSSGTEQMNRAAEQLDQTVQSNAASAEQLASTAEELAAQATSLAEQVGYFRLGERPAAPPPENRAESSNGGKSVSRREEPIESAKKRHREPVKTFHAITLHASDRPVEDDRMLDDGFEEF